MQTVLISEPAMAGPTLTYWLKRGVYARTAVERAPRFVAAAMSSISAGGATRSPTPMIARTEYDCGHSVAVEVGRWPDDPVVHIEPRIVCQGCGNRSADIRPDLTEKGERRHERGLIAAPQRPGLDHLNCRVHPYKYP